MGTLLFTPYILLGNFQVLFRRPVWESSLLFSSARSVVQCKKPQMLSKLGAKVLGIIWHHLCMAQGQQGHTQQCSGTVHWQGSSWAWGTQSISLQHAPLFYSSIKWWSWKMWVTNSFYRTSEKCLALNDSNFPLSQGYHSFTLLTKSCKHKHCEYNANKIIIHTTSTLPLYCQKAQQPLPHLTVSVM